MGLLESVRATLQSIAWHIASGVRIVVALVRFERLWGNKPQHLAAFGACSLREHDGFPNEAPKRSDIKVCAQGSLENGIR